MIHCEKTYPEIDLGDQIAVNRYAWLCLSTQLPRHGFVPQLDPFQPALSIDFATVLFRESCRFANVANVALRGRLRSNSRPLYLRTRFTRGTR